MEPVMFGKATIYTKSEFGFGYRKVEVREGSYQVRPYAQYAEALEVRFKRPRERNARGFVDASLSAYGGMGTIILEGWGHPDPEAMWEAVKSTPEVEVARSKHTAFDPAWSASFKAMMDAYLATQKAKVVIDVRGKCSGSR